jgi:hypothetical protein
VNNNETGSSASQNTLEKLFQQNDEILEKLNLIINKLDDDDNKNTNNEWIEVRFNENLLIINKIYYLL